jgi:hypothetical protein
MRWSTMWRGSSAQDRSPLFDRDNINRDTKRLENREW